jgi:hypothetical protein
MSMGKKNILKIKKSLNEKDDIKKDLNYNKNISLTPMI